MELLDSKRYVVILVLILGCVLAASGAVIEVVTWWDGFETHEPCGRFIKGLRPPSDIDGYDKWGDLGIQYFYQTVDCSTAYTGAKSLSTLRFGEKYGGPVARSIYPYMFIHEGVTLFYEFDVYIPTNSECEFLAYPIQGEIEHSPAGLWASGIPGTMWQYLGRTIDPQTERYYHDSSVPVEADVWNHVRVEIYDDYSYSVFVTPDGGLEQVVAANVPSPTMENPSSDIELWIQARNGQVYWDNIRMGYINNQAQGYPSIKQAPAGITIDGQLSAGEWEGVRKVANKPLAGAGNFKPSFYSNWDYRLDPDEQVDVYAAYDATAENCFYIAGRFNKAVFGQAEPGDNSHFEAVFAFDSKDWQEDIDYVFNCTASAGSGSGSYYAIVRGSPPGTPVSQLQPPVTIPLDANDFADAGGEIAYSVAGDVMEVEMKVPFSFLTDKNGGASLINPVAGEKVNLQFNVSGMVDGFLGPTFGVYTTNIAFETAPWTLCWTEMGVPFGAGVMFPACGDDLHAYPAGDITKDCRVDLDDLCALAAAWLACNRPACGP